MKNNVGAQYFVLLQSMFGTRLVHDTNVHQIFSALVHNFVRHPAKLWMLSLLTGYEVWYLSSDIPLRISTNIPLAEQVDL